MCIHSHKKEYFHPVTMKMYAYIHCDLNFKHDLKRVKLKQHVKYLGQKVFSSKGYCTDIHTQSDQLL